MKLGIGIAQRCLHLPDKQVRKAAHPGSGFSLQLTFESICHLQYSQNKFLKAVFPLTATAVAIVNKSFILVGMDTSGGEGALYVL